MAALFSRRIAGRAMAVKGLVLRLSTFVSCGSFVWAGAIALTLLGTKAKAAHVPKDAIVKCDSAVAAKLKSNSGVGKVTVIVQLSVGYGDREASSLRRLGAKVRQRFDSIDAIAVEIDQSSLIRLCKFDWVKRVSWNFQVSKTDDFTVGHTFADAAWKGAGSKQGSGINIAIVDSGVNPAKDFSQGLGNRVVAHVDFSLRKLDLVEDGGLQDPCGHGTIVAGLAAGNGSSSSGTNAIQSYMGIAPRAGIVSVRVLERDGSGSVSTVLAGLNWVYLNRRAFNIRVVNLSLGHPVGESYKTDPMCLMVEKLWKSGVVVVCAAGNMGRLEETQDISVDNEGWGTAYGSIQVPGNSPYAITVGAAKRMPDNVRANDRIATYSSRGPTIFDYVLKPDLIAPGNLVISVGPSDGYLFDEHQGNMVPLEQYLKATIRKLLNDNRYFELSGTSMAAPVVSGSVAMMLAREPLLSPDTVKARLMVSADKWAYPADPNTDSAQDLTDPFTFGAGMLNIPNALSSRIIATIPAMSPAVGLDSNGNLILQIDSLMSGTRGFWGTGLKNPSPVYGERALWGTGTASGTRAVWGVNSGKVDGTRAVWGTTKTVEGNRAVWGTGAPRCDLTSIAIEGD